MWGNAIPNLWNELMDYNTAGTAHLSLLDSQHRALCERQFSYSSSPFNPFNFPSDLGFDIVCFCGYFT